MSHIPDAFAERLRSTFDGRLRIRWSVRAQEFRIEQKVGNAVVAPIRIDEDRDDLICARDGYDYVMSIRNGTRMPCPTCQFTELTVPALDTAHIRCSYCASKGLDGRVTAGYWPLEDALIDHLRKIDPLRGQTFELSAATDRRNRALLQSNENSISDIVISKGAEDYDALVGIPHFGYSTAKMWPAEMGPQPNQAS